MPHTIEAAVMVEPGRIEIQSFPAPQLEPGAVLLQVEMCGICGTDKHTWRGETKQYAGTDAESDTPFPIIPGHEVIGVVAEVNERGGPRLDFNGERLSAGDRVALCPDVVCGRCHACRHTFAFPYCEQLRGYGNGFSSSAAPHLFGGWAQAMYILPNAFVYKVPPALPLRVAVMAELMAVSYNLDKTKEFFTLSGEGFATGCTVVVQGAGPMGICHIVKARVMGAGLVIATDASDFRLDLARQFGADQTLNVSALNDEDQVAFVRSLTGGRGADLVAECAGVASAVPVGLDMLRKGGVYVEAGNFADTGEIALNPHRHLCAKNVRLIGMTNHPFTGYTPSMALMERYAERFPFEKFVTHEYPLAQTAEALLKSLDASGCMKVVVRP